MKFNAFGIGNTQEASEMYNYLLVLLIFIDGSLKDSQRSQNPSAIQPRDHQKTGFG
jgi:hypothetical protein